MLFYDEFSGLIYQGKVVRVQTNRALIETQKKTFKVALANVKLLCRDQSLVKSEFFSRDDSESHAPASQNQLHLTFLPPGPEQPFSVQRGTNSQNLSSFLRTNQTPFAPPPEAPPDFSLPLFGKAVSGTPDSVRLGAPSEKTISKPDFPSLRGLGSMKQGSSKFQSVLGNSMLKDFAAPQLNTSQKSSGQPSKPFKRVSTGISQSQPLNKPGQGGSLFVLPPAALDSKETPRAETRTESSVVDKDLVNFAILFKLLQKKKKLAEMHDRLVRSGSEADLETHSEDLQWVRRSVSRIDGTLKNVWLSLKLRDKTIKRRLTSRRPARRLL